MKILGTFGNILGFAKILNPQIFKNFRDFSNIPRIFLVRPRSKNRLKTPVKLNVTKIRDENVFSVTLIPKRTFILKVKSQTEFLEVENYKDTPRN